MAGSASNVNEWLSVLFCLTLLTSVSLCCSRQVFISGAGASDVYLVMARTGHAGSQGITALVVEKVWGKGVGITALLVENAGCGVSGHLPACILGEERKGCSSPDILVAS